MTGGAGFIGSNLVRGILAREWQATVLDDCSTGREENIREISAHFVRGSILDLEIVKMLTDGVDAVVHLAARPSVPRSLADPLGSNEVNVTGTLNVLEAARASGSHPIVIVASSSSVYGSNSILPKSEDLQPMPASPYAVSKLAAESYTLAYQRCFDMPTLAFRFFNVYGPFQLPDSAYAAVVPKFLRAVCRNEPLPIEGGGNQTRDFTFIDTVVETLLDAVSRRVVSASPVNLAFGSRVSLLEVAAEIEAMTGTTLERLSFPARKGDVHDSQASAKLFRSLFPHVSPTPLRTGLERTFEWMTDYLGTAALGANGRG